MTLAMILPDLLALAEAAFGPKVGKDKQEAVINAVTQGMKDSGVSNWIVSIVGNLLQVVIPLLVAKYNADPNNKLFVKSPTP